MSDVLKSRISSLIAVAIFAVIGILVSVAVLLVCSVFLSLANNSEDYAFAMVAASVLAGSVLMGFLTVGKFKHKRLIYCSAAGTVFAFLMLLIGFVFSLGHVDLSNTVYCIIAILGSIAGGILKK